MSGQKSVAWGLMDRRSWHETVQCQPPSQCYFDLPHICVTDIVHFNT